MGGKLCAGVESLYCFGVVVFDVEEELAVEEVGGGVFGVGADGFLVVGLRSGVVLRHLFAKCAVGAQKC